MDKEKFPLSASIQAHGETLTELLVRRPTPLECRAIRALPYQLTEQGLPVVEIETACKYMAVCCGIPPSSVNQLELYDLNQLAWMIVGFFVNSKATEKATPSTESSEEPST